MTTIANSIVGINGVISTDKSVLQNLQTIASAAGCWITYDVTQGKWAVVINKAGTSVASFNDTNIVGSINISGKGVNELYNSATIEFPHRELRDQKDYVDLIVSSGDRFPNELDNKLNIASDLINDPIQAQYIASVELKQSRVDKIIQFRTDYSYIGLKAGDLIDVTSDMYGYTNKIFRITRLEESDDDVLSISITALEYDANVYSTAGLTRELREKKTGIVARQVNTAVRSSDSFSVATQNTEKASDVLTPLAIANAVALGVGPLFNFLKSSSNVTNEGFKANNPGTSIPGFFASTGQIPANDVLTSFNGYMGGVTQDGVDQGSGPDGDLNASVFLEWNLPQAMDNLIVTVESPLSQYYAFPFDIAGFVTYDIWGINSYDEIEIEGNLFVANLSYEEVPVIVDREYTYLPTEVIGYIPMDMTLFFNGNAVATKRTNYSTATATIAFNNCPAGDYLIAFQPAPATEMYHKAPGQFGIWTGGYGQPSGADSSIYVTIQAFKQT